MRASESERSIKRSGNYNSPFLVHKSIVTLVILMVKQSLAVQPLCVV